MSACLVLLLTTESTHASAIRGIKRGTRAVGPNRVTGRALKGSSMSGKGKGGKGKGGMDSEDEEGLLIEIPVVVATGDQEVPDAIATKTTAELELTFDRGLTEVEYKLIVNNGKSITQAHLHCNFAGANGGIIANLAVLNADLAGVGEDVDGTLVEGVLTTDDLLDCAELAGFTVNIATLYDSIRDGAIYLNVHSTANPSGVVRGQIFAD
jgi:CHRD domain